MNPRSTLLLVAGLASLSPAASAQSLKQVHLPPNGEPTAEAFGADVCALSDVDGDGVGDFAVLATRFPNADPAVRVFSGADRRVLLSIDLGNLPATDTIRIADGGDQDGDGAPELLVGQPYYPSLFVRNGIVRVFSLRTGELVRNHIGSSSIHLGASVAGVGDVNGDGFDDYAAGAPFGGLAQSGVGYVYSGQDGSLLHTQLNPDFNGDSTIGWTIGPVGDANGDGVQDMVVAGKALAVLYSPSTGQFIEDIFSEPTVTWEALTALGDTNGDGRDDFALGAPEFGVDYPGFENDITDAGRVQVFTCQAPFDVVSSVWFKFGTSENARIGKALGRHAVQGPDRVVVAGERTAEMRNGSTGAVLHTWLPYADLASINYGEVRVAVIGDISGDGRSDVLVGCPDAMLDSSSSLGRVDLYSGVADYEILERLESRSGQSFGGAVALLEDVDGDGEPETVVGTPHEDAATVYGGGTVRLRSSATGQDLWVHSGQAGDQAGTALLRLPDIDGDGIGEVVVGAPRSDHGNQGIGPFRPGSVTVLSGRTGAELYEVIGLESGELYGAALAAVGDVDGDGVEDFAVGAPGFEYGSPDGDPEGRFEARSGADGAHLGYPNGQQNVGRTGASLAGLGDVNGNGVPDVAVGAPVAGRVRVWELPTGPILWTFVATGGLQTGTALAALDDVDGDGVQDLAIGAPPAVNDENTVGRVYVVSGTSPTIIHQILGPGYGARFGASVASAGDVDLDGATDVAVGSPGAITGLTGFGAGRVEIYRATGSTDPLRSWSGTSFDQRLGASLAGGLDVDADGIPDLAAGAPGFQQTLGMAQVLSARAKFTLPFGTGTEGCDGAHLFAAAMPPELGTLLELRGTNAAPGAIVFGLYSLGQDVPGTDWGLGFLLHISPFQHFLTLNGVADGAGRVTFPLPLPDAPNLAGAKLHTQAVFSFAGAPCGQLPLLLSSSHGLSLTLH